MLQETLRRIEGRIQDADSLCPEAKCELLDLLVTLKTEVEQLSRTHTDQAQTITGFAQVSAHEATREERNPRLLRLSLDGLAASVDGFEQSHPRLVEIVNRICTTLSSLGV